MATAKKTSKTEDASVTKQIHGFVKDAQYPTLYSNFMGVGASPFDVSIIFAEVDQSEEGSSAIPRMKVIMAPEQAANLIYMLSQVLKQYVAANGKLRAGGRMDVAE
jgi:hypothetical protein